MKTTENYNIKKFATKAKVLKFINSKLFGDNKINRLSTYTNEFIIFDVILKNDDMCFCPSFCGIQSISNYCNQVKITYTICNDYKGFGSIINEMNYFKLV